MNRTPITGALTGALACLILLLASCGDEPPVPSYIHIPAITVATDYATDGSASSKITDVWIYIDDELQGVYTLPATFPVQRTGATRVTVSAGIQVNGISATRAPYPMYNDSVLTVELEETKTDTIYPVVRYYTNAEFAIKEDFETGNVFSNMDKVTGSEALEGTFSGKIETDTAGTVQSISTDRYYIPFGASAVYLELDYKNNQTFNIGLNMYKDGQGIGFQKVTLSTKEERNKVYINFTQEITQNQPDEVEVVFTVDSSNVSAATAIYLDNIKFVYFP